MFAYRQSQFSETVGNLIDGSEKRNRQLRFQIDNSHDSDKGSNIKLLFPITVWYSIFKSPIPKSNNLGKIII